MAAHILSIIADQLAAMYYVTKWVCIHMNYIVSMGASATNTNGTTMSILNKKYSSVFLPHL